MNLDIISYGLFGVMSFYLLRIVLALFPKQENKEKIESFFENAGLCNKSKQYPLIIKKEEKENYDLYICNMPAGMELQDFEKKEKALENALKGHIDIWNHYSTLYIRKSNNEMKNIISYNKQEISQALANYRLAIPIGYDRTKLIIHDLLGQGSHAMLAGTTNFGKTHLLHIIINALMQNYSTRRVIINPLDLKNGTEFRRYIHAEHTGQYADNAKDAAAILQDLKTELEKRTKLMRKHNLSKIHKLNKSYIITIIDEFAVLAKNQDAIDGLIYLCQQGRAAGLHFIVATQYPKHNIIPTDIRINFDVRIALHLAERTASEVVLGNSLASEIPEVPGRAIYKFGKCQEVQIPYLEKLPVFKEKSTTAKKEEAEEERGPIF